MQLLKWLPHCFLPYNLLFALSAWAWWKRVLPSPEAMQTLAAGWILQLFIVDVVAVFIF